MRAGAVSQFEVRFPGDYGHPGLAGRTVAFQVFLHQVMEPVLLENITDLLENPPRNIYRFNDLAGLRKQNENLYYLTLRDSVPWKLTQEMTDFLSLLNFYLKLGLQEQASGLLDLLPPDGSMHEHAGRILLAGNQPEKTLAILGRTPSGGAEAAITKAKALIKMTRYEEAEKAVDSPSLAGDIQVLDLRVGLASLMGQPLGIYLARMDDLINRQISFMRVEAGG
jgi:hypothetical protein